MAYYKIVETIEEGEKYLSSVPYKWDKKNILYWPPTRNINKYIKDINSSPAPTWSKQPCTVKKTGISSLLEAKTIENRMADFTDTEAEENYEVMKRNKRKHPGEELDDITDFNHLLDNLSSAEEHGVITEQPAPVVPLTEESQVQFTSDMQLPNSTEISEEISIIDFGDISQKITEINKNVNHNSAKFDNISKEICSLHVKFDRIIELLSSNNNSEKKSVETDLKELIDKVVVLSMTNEKDVELLEKKLETDKDFKQNVKEYMSRIGGKGGDKNGNKIAYKIIDQFFSRAVLLKFSWTGSSKNKEKKISFLKFTNIISMFYDIIYAADNRFTTTDNEDFFRKILKNSLSRSNQICLKRKKAENVNVNEEENVPEANTKNTEDQQISNENEEEDNDLRDDE